MGCCGDNGTGDAVELKSSGEGGAEGGGKYGTPKKFDPSFNGPIKNRSCTDVICCILFVIFIVAMVIVGILGMNLCLNCLKVKTFAGGNFFASSGMFWSFTKVYTHKIII